MTPQAQTAQAQHPQMGEAPARPEAKIVGFPHGEPVQPKPTFGDQTAQDCMSSALAKAGFESVAYERVGSRYKNPMSAIIEMAEQKPDKTFMVAVDAFSRADLADIRTAFERNSAANIVVHYTQDRIFDHPTDKTASYVHAFGRASAIREALYPDQVQGEVDAVKDQTGIRMIMAASFKMWPR